MYQKNSLPKGFIFLEEVDNTIIESVRYFGAENFTGRPVPGYTNKKIILTLSAAQALKKVQLELKSSGYKLVIYDGYRPQRAVDSWVKWSEDQKDQKAKHLYYPMVDKKDIFQLGYVGKQSSHSRGSTVDLTIIPIQKNSLQPIKITERKLNDGRAIPFLDDGTVDMGSSFDLLDEASHHNSPLVSQEVIKMRDFLKNIMKKFGFKEYEKEWWHYTLENEPYLDTYFDFVIYS